MNGITLREYPLIARSLLRSLGPRGLLLRAVHEYRRAKGSFREQPKVLKFAEGEPLQSLAVSHESLQRMERQQLAVERAERVASGEYQAFGWEWRRLPRGQHNWHRNPSTGAVLSNTVPWWRIAHLDPTKGDIKEVWEPGRFGWTYDLIRGYRLTENDRFAQAFHDILADWWQSNPPFRGAHWSCGQETSIRAIALLYAEANLRDAPSSDQAAQARIASVLAASGERIADAIGYGVSQRNNHGISEAVGLILLGMRFNGSHPEAPEWLRRGKRLLDRLISEQFHDDGWYAQNSFTYLRLALDQCVLAERALRASGLRLSVRARERLAAATRLLISAVDSDSGDLPNRGANDGALVHPISLAEYRDFRPVITAACATFNVPLPRDIQADQDALAWLDAEVERSASRVDGIEYGSHSGWVSIRVGAWAVFLRAGSARFRPGHVDALHIDVRFRGKALVVDPGTFSYNAAGIWRGALSGGREHNGPFINGDDGVLRGPRFLTLKWPEGRVIDYEWDGRQARVIIEVAGIARRTIRADSDGLEVRDTPLSPSVSRVTVRWLLGPEADPSALRVNGGSRTMKANEGDVLGWYCPTYLKRVASRWVEAERELAGSEALVTWMGPAAQASRNQVNLTATAHAVIPSDDTLNDV